MSNETDSDQVSEQRNAEFLPMDEKNRVLDENRVKKIFFRKHELASEMTLKQRSEEQEVLSIWK